MVRVRRANKTTEVLALTIANQLAQCLASVESAAANLKTFSLQTQDQQAKQMFQQLSNTMDHAVQQLKGRLDYVMQEEPQYRNEIGGTYNMSTWTQGGGAQTGQGTGGFGSTTGTGGINMGTFGGGMGGTTMGGNTMGSTTMGQGGTTNSMGSTTGGLAGGTLGNPTLLTNPTQISGTGTTTSSGNSSNSGSKNKKNNKS